MIIHIGVFVCILVVSIILFGRYYIYFQFECLSEKMYYKTYIDSWCRLFHLEYDKMPNMSQFRIHVVHRKVYERKLSRNRYDTVEKEKFQGNKDRIKKIRDYLCYIRKFQDRFLKIVMGVIRSFKFEQLVLKGKIGLRSPSNTGIIFGVVQSAQSLFSDKVHIDMIPDFYQQKHECIFNVEIRCILIVLLCRIVSMLLYTGWVVLKCKLSV